MATKDSSTDKVQRVLAPLLVGLLFLTFWEVSISQLGIKTYILPPPSEILVTLIDDWQLLMRSWLVTLSVTFIAFALAVGIGVLLALLFVQSRWIEMSLYPYAIAMQVTPVVAIAPLIIIWVDSTLTALVICAVIIAIFPIISNTTLGLHSVNPNLLQLFRMHRASRWQILTRLRIPSALPYFFGSLRISSGLALIGAVVAEFVAGTGGTKAGLAYVILNAGFTLKIPRMFAALVLIALTGIVLFMLMLWFTRLALGNWHESMIEHEE